MKNPLAVGLEALDTADPLAIFVFGVTGDLTRKKLIPALYSLFLNGRLTDFKVIGFARREWSREYMQEKGAEMIEDMPGSDEQRKRFLASLDYLQSTFEDDE
ncbi:MAG: glucose-6-phosphate dehydrogenase, partial [Spirochaetota bacterium]